MPCLSILARRATLVAALWLPAGARAAAAAPAAARAGLHPVDWIIVALYLGGILGLGAWVARRQSSTADYFIAAGRHLPPFLVGVSVFASLLSAISYLNKPGEMIGKGPVVLIAQILSVPFAYLVVAHVLLPRIMRQRVTSAYELLEEHLGATGRLLGALLFIKLRLVWMGLLVHVAARALAVILGLDAAWLPGLSAVVGIVPLVYAAMGGLRAVVLANVVQFFLLLLGALLSIALITVRCGGFSWWPEGWSPGWDQQPLFSPDPRVRVTVVGALLSIVTWRIATAGGDQMVIQHYMATRDLAAARRSYLVTSIATIVVTVVLAVLGLALLGFFQRFPGLLGPGMDLYRDADHVFPYFVTHLLPVGLSGLVVAAILAASSGLDTGVNAVTAVVSRDLLARHGWEPDDEAGRLRLTRRLSWGIGFAVVGLSLLVARVPGNFMEVSTKLANLESTTIFGLFFLALFVRRATPLAAVAGAAYGLAAAALIAFWDLLTGEPGWSFLYLGPAGLALNLGVGWAVSRWGPRPEQRGATAVAAAALLAALVVGVVRVLPG